MVAEHFTYLQYFSSDRSCQHTVTITRIGFQEERRVSRENDRKIDFIDRYMDDHSNNIFENANYFNFQVATPILPPAF